MSKAVACDCDKVTYVSRREAITAGKRLERRGLKSAQRPYRCPVGNWHLTSTPSTPKKHLAERQIRRAAKAPGPGKGKHHGRDRRKQKPLAPLTPVAWLDDHRSPSSDPEVPQRKHTGCVSCGRPWKSDISPVGRSCPQCGGTVVIGWADQREFIRELAA